MKAGVFGVSRMRIRRPLMADINPLVAVTVGVALDVFQFDFHFVPGLFHLAGLVHLSSSAFPAPARRRLAENDGAIRPHPRNR